MADQHPITPPPELVQQWMREAHDQPPGPDARLIAALAARWGADQELEACCGWVEREIGHGRDWGAELRAARRPKTPSLKQQALDALEMEDDSMPLRSIARGERFALIRRALEQLNE